MRRCLLCVLVLAILGWGCAHPKEPTVGVRATGFDPTFHGVPPPAQDRDIIVATVKEVSAEPATNGNPPTVVLLVHEALRGDLRPGTTITAQWNAPWHGVDYVGDGAAAQIKQWEQRPMIKPDVGLKFLLAGHRLDGDPLLYVNGTGKLAFTPKARREVVEQIAKFDARTSPSR